MSENILSFRSNSISQKPRNLLHSYMIVAQMVAMSCSIVAGVSTALAFWDSSAGLHGTLMPLLGGVLIAFGLGALWHKAIHFATHAREGLSKGALAGICLGGALMAAATSSLGLATILSGRTSLNKHQFQAVEQQAASLRMAWQQAERQGEIIAALDEASAAWNALAEAEGKGWASGVKGKQVIYGLFKASADRYEERSTSAKRTFAKFDALHTKTVKLINEEHDLVGKDDGAFEDAANSTRENTTAIADFDLAPLAYGVALVDFRTALRDRDAIDRIETNAKAIVSHLEQHVRAVTDDRENIKVPSYQPMTPRDAVISFASSEAAPGWIVALGLDCLLPSLFVLLIFAATREAPVVNGAAPPPRHPIEPGDGPGNPPGAA